MFQKFWARKKINSKHNSIGLPFTISSDIDIPQQSVFNNPHHTVFVNYSTVVVQM